MKGDFTRSTFKPEKHYSGVRMQQGRVLLDADWNEQADLINHRSETGTADTFGVSGAPKDDPGFGITDDLKISKGRFYVNGILCVNEEQISLEQQKDFPSLRLPTAEGYYLAYLDVWQRHLTALDEPSLKEEALRSADTTTRTQTVWQVKLSGKVDKIDKGCATTFADYDSLHARSRGKMSAQIKPQGTVGGDASSPVVRTSFEDLQNQLYRIEIHIPWNPKGKQKEEENQEGTFKWSRDNGIFVSGVKEINRKAAAGPEPASEPESGDLAALAAAEDKGNTIILLEPPRDEETAFAAGQWVELIDEAREVREEPGILVRLISPTEGTTLTFDPATPDNEEIPKVTAQEAKEQKWKVRRWDARPDDLDRRPDIPIEPNLDIVLENDIVIRFDLDYRSLHTGDYWLIPSRSTSKRIEWPFDEIAEAPVALEPFGVKHHYARLAILHLASGGQWSVASDCRKIVTSLADQINLFYLGGDGQEGYPNEELPQPLRVGVTSGLRPVPDALVKFKVEAEHGNVYAESGSKEPIKGALPTDAKGVVECYWRLGKVPADQIVTATLVDETGQPLHAPIQFKATLNLALSYRGGDGQEGYPEELLPQPLIVGVTRGLQAVANQKIKFEISEGAGKFFLDNAGQSEVQGSLLTDANGIAKCFWKMGLTAQHQNVIATLLNADEQPLHAPIQFKATLNLALSYRGGDGQEGYPEEPLPQPLIVGVTRGLQAVDGQMVEFKIEGGGKLYADKERTTEVTEPLRTKDGGLAKCFWQMGKTAALQTVTATLLNEEKKSTHVPITFSAKLNLALHYRGGDGQEGYPEEPLSQPLIVGVTRGMEAVDGQMVEFKIEGGGKLYADKERTTEVTEPLRTKEGGLAKCFWQIGKTAALQTVTATLLNEEKKPTHVPITFSAKLNLALSYRGGDGQEGYPDEPLSQPLIVGVTRGLQAVDGQMVEFKIEGGGKLYADKERTTEVTEPLRTKEGGLAKCFWQMGKTAALQTVTATLLNEEKKPTHVPITFSAKLNLALSYRGGDGQEGIPEEMLPQPLQVSVTRGVVPVVNQVIEFKIFEGEGALFEDDGGARPLTAPVRTNERGVALCYWKMGKTEPRQSVTATLIDAPDKPFYASIHFSAHVLPASAVQYETPTCGTVEAPSVRSLFEEGTAKVEKWPDLDADKHVTVKDMLDGLLCHLTAARLPFLHKQDNSGDAKFPEDVAQTVSAALNFLSRHLVPAGMVMAFANETAPWGWLECNGRQITIGEFKDLYTALTGSDTDIGSVNIPDLRGEFVRGWDGGERGSRGSDPDREKRKDVEGKDAGNHVGTYQGDQIQAHKHLDGGHFHPEPTDGHDHKISASKLHTHGIRKVHEIANGVAVASQAEVPASDISTEFATTGLGSGKANLDKPVNLNDADQGEISGSETRPRNVALMYCIKT